MRERDSLPLSTTTTYKPDFGSFEKVSFPSSLTVLEAEQNSLEINKFLLHPPLCAAAAAAAVKSTFSTCVTHQERKKVYLSPEEINT
jgi:hypothetical protein